MDLDYKNFTLEDIISLCSEEKDEPKFYFDKIIKEKTDNNI